MTNPQLSLEISTPHQRAVIPGFGFFLTSCFAILQSTAFIYLEKSRLLIHSYFRMKKKNGTRFRENYFMYVCIYIRDSPDISHIPLMSHEFDLDLITTSGQMGTIISNWMPYTQKREKNNYWLVYYKELLHREPMWVHKSHKYKVKIL